MNLIDCERNCFVEWERKKFILVYVLEIIGYSYSSKGKEYFLSIFFKC